MPPLYFSGCFYFGDFFFFLQKARASSQKTRGDKDIILLQILYGLYVISIK